MEEVGCICRPGETCNCFDKLPGNIRVNTSRVVEGPPAPPAQSQQAQIEKRKREQEQRDAKQRERDAKQREADAITGRFESAVKSANQMKAEKEAKYLEDGVWTNNIEEGKRAEMNRIVKEKKNQENVLIAQKKQEAINATLRKLYQTDPKVKEEYNRKKNEEEKAKKEKEMKDAAMYQNAFKRNPLVTNKQKKINAALSELYAKNPTKDRKMLLANFLENEKQQKMLKKNKNKKNENDLFDGGKRRSRRSRRSRSRSRRSRRKTRRIKKTH